MIKFILNPFDILFFGSGKPFNVNVQEAISIFPPFPNTLASSICSKIYSEKGINIKNIIKSFYGPFLQNNKGILFPKPLDILGEKKKINRELSNAYLLGNPKLINPSYTDLKNDLKNILWQKSKNKDFEIFESFITLDGLKKWLNNQEIENCDLVDKKEIFEIEPRIGIKMDYSRNITEEEDALYRVDFIRLKKDAKIIFFVEFNFEDDELKNCGLSDENKIFEFFSKEPSVLKLGGEMKNVYYECEKVSIKSFGFREPSIENDDIIKILYLTPGFLEKSNSYEIINASINITNLEMSTKNYGIKIRKGIKEGSVVYAKVKDKKSFKDLWLKPKSGEFIGSNLRIYTKYNDNGR